VDEGGEIEATCGLLTVVCVGVMIIVSGMVFVVLAAIIASMIWRCKIEYRARLC
jgi:hypothetical protein